MRHTGERTHQTCPCTIIRCFNLLVLGFSAFDGPSAWGILEVASFWGSIMFFRCIFRLLSRYIKQFYIIVDDHTAPFFYLVLDVRTGSSKSFGVHILRFALVPGFSLKIRISFKTWSIIDMSTGSGTWFHKLPTSTSCFANKSWNCAFPDDCCHFGQLLCKITVSSIANWRWSGNIGRIWHV